MKDLPGLRPPLLEGGDFQSTTPTSEIPSFEEGWPKAGEVFHFLMSGYKFVTHWRFDAPLENVTRRLSRKP